MKLATRMILAVFVTAMMSNLARAQVMDQVPANAAVVIEIKNLDSANTKLINFFKALGVSQDAPGLDDPMAFALAQAKISAGLNRTGDWAMVMIDPGPEMNWSKAPLMLIPVSDYQAFIGNFPDAKTNGDITTFSMNGDPMPTFCAHWGNYAAISPNQDNVTNAPAGLKITGASAKELDTKDAVIIANLKVLGTEALPALEQARAAATAGIDQQAGTNPMLSKYAAVLKVIVNQALNVPKALFTDCDFISIGIGMDDDGVTETAVADFHADSYMGKINAQMKTSEDSLLAGLPQANYIVLGGATADPKLGAQVVGDFVDPIIAELQNVGPDAQPIVDYINAFKDIVANQTGTTFGLLQPQGELGQQPLLQFINIARGDSHAILGDEHKLIDSQIAIMKAFGVPSPMKTTFTAGAKTVGDVTFDQIHTQMDPAMAGNMPPQASMFMNFLYGQDGMSAYVGPVDAQTLLTVGGASDDTLTAAVTAVKANDDTIGKQTGIQNTAGHLPKDRQFVLYLPIDTLTNTIVDFAGKFGFPINITMPAMDPLGVTFKADGTAFREDMYVPTKAIAAVVDSVKKLQHTGGPGAAPGGPGAPPPGGL